MTKTRCLLHFKRHKTGKLPFSQLNKEFKNLTLYIFFHLDLHLKTKNLLWNWALLLLKILIYRKSCQTVEQTFKTIVYNKNDQLYTNLLKTKFISWRAYLYKNGCMKNLVPMRNFLWESSKWLQCDYNNKLILYFHSEKWK